MHPSKDAQDRFEQYAKPEIADYGDLIELTAHGATGRHVDASFVYGEEATFISSAP